MVEIRDVVLGDVEAVRDVLVQTWHATYDPLIGEARVTELTDDWHAIDTLRRQCDPEGGVFLLAEAGGEVVGTASGHRAEEGSTLDRLYVLPSWQGRAIGRALLRELTERLGEGPMRVEVHAENAAAIAFYERAGFVPIARAEDDVIMRRP